MTALMRKSGKVGNMLWSLPFLLMIAFGSYVAWNQNTLRENETVVAVRKALEPVCNKLP